MQIDAFWMGWSDVWRANRGAGWLSDAVARIGGWNEVWRRGPRAWDDLGLGAADRERLRSARPYETCGIGITPLDGTYPRQLAKFPDAPPLLFVEGDPDALAEGAVAIVGTRRCTQQGRAIARELGAGIARTGRTVVSGLALGIDAEAHRGALHNGRTAAVLAHGLAHTAPMRHRRLRREIVEQGGAMVTLWRDEVAPRPWTFPTRNRWIAALSQHVVVVEAPIKSGTLHTARAAWELGIDLRVVPGPLNSPAHEGSNQMLERCEAGGIASVDRFIAELGGPPADPDSWRAALFSGAPLDEVARLKGVSLVELYELLQWMEARGEVVRLAGRRYARG